jgi:biopolymer transport protein ExbB
MRGTRERSVAWLVAIAVAALPGCSFRRLPGAPDDATPDPGDDAADDAAVDGMVPPDAARVWWNPAWKNRRKVIIKNTELAGPVQKFPLLVKLPAGIAPAQVRFLAADQSTVLSHELDSSNATGATFWVRIPDIQNTGTAPEVWAYYGNGSASSTSSGANVFADLFVSVHHLDQNGTDATGHGHTANSNGNERPADTTGQIGDARDFDGSNDHLDLVAEAAYDFTTALTVSAWIKRQDLGAVPYMAIVTKGDSAWRLARQDLTQFVGFGTDEGATSQNLAGSKSIDDDTWHHVAITLGNGTKRIFVDGLMDTMANANAVNVNNIEVSLGQNAESVTGGKRFWNGDIDEVRISGTAHDAAWLHAEHHTATDPDFVQLGPDEPYAP